MGNAGIAQRMNSPLGQVARPELLLDPSFGNPDDCFTLSCDHFPLLAPPAHYFSPSITIHTLCVIQTTTTLPDMSSFDSFDTTDYSLSFERLHMMRRQEATSYRMSTDHLVEASQESRDFPSDLPLYLEWRKQMIGWNYSIANTCKFQKDTVEIAVSIVDRFVAVQTELLNNAHQYQVACMASLYIAAKIHEEHCLTPKQMESLSAGRFRADDIEEMERDILSAIEWRVNPPTAAAFCRALLDLVPLELVPDRATVMDIADSHIQLAITEEYFLSVDASSLGFASLMNALQCVLGHGNSTKQFFGDFSKALLVDGVEPHIQHCACEMDCLRRKLRMLVVDSLLSGKILNDAMATAYRGSEKGQYNDSLVHPNHLEGSPRSVAKGPRSVGVLI